MTFENSLALIMRNYPGPTPEQMFTIRFNWRVNWVFYKDNVEINRGNKDFMVALTAEKFITDMRKLAVKEDLGIVIDKINLREGIPVKRFKKGYRRKW